MDQAVHETNISRNYLEALEGELFDEFPAEAYLVGFLKNYADFLGLDADKMVGQFKNYKLSEEPTPIAELVGPPKGAAVKKALPWVLLVVALGTGAVFGFPRVMDAVSQWRAQRPQVEDQDVEADAPTEVEEPTTRVIQPVPPSWEGEVQPGDTLILGEGENTISFLVSAGDGVLRLTAPDTEPLRFLLGESAIVPGIAGAPAWSLMLKDFGLPGGGGVLEVKVVGADPAEQEFSAENLPTSAPSGEVQRKREVQRVLNASTPDRYTLDVAFRDYCLFRYQVDGQEPREAYYGAGENLRLEANRLVTIWVSNAGSAYAKVGGKELNLGQRGEVSVRRLRWILDEATGSYDLTLIPLY